MDLVLHPLEKILQWSLEKNGGRGGKDGGDDDDFLDENNNNECRQSDVEGRGEAKYFSIFVCASSSKRHSAEVKEVLSFCAKLYAQIRQKKMPLSWD